MRLLNLSTSTTASHTPEAVSLQPHTPVVCPADAMGVAGDPRHNQVGTAGREVIVHDVELTSSGAARPGCSMSIAQGPLHAW